VHAEDLVVLFLRHDLHEPFYLPRDLRAAQHAEWKCPNPHVVSAPLRFGLRQADAADLGIAVRATRHLVVVDGAHLLARNALGHVDPLG
jgi:hypothetical protein